MWLGSLEKVTFDRRFGLPRTV